jgi:hypothetical protein
MSAVARPETGPGKRRNRATMAFLLGLASPSLIVAGWLWGFVLLDLGLFAAVAALPYSVLGLRRGGAKLLAAAGLLLALLTLAVVVLFILSFAINPPE